MKITVILLALMLCACGLPTVFIVDPPVAIDTTSSDTIVGFSTPSNDNDVIGYAIYYKIYKDTGSYDADKQFFDNEGEKLQAGKSAAISKGFSKVGIQSASGRSLPGDTSGAIREIDKNSSTEYIFIDANPTGVSDDDKRLEPKIGYSNSFTSSVPAFSTLTDLGTSLTRGYVDIRSDSALRSFVNDWAYGTVQADYFDGDLRSPARNSQQPGIASNITDWQQFAPLFDTSSVPSNLYIGFLVYTISFLHTSGKFEFAYSQPVHIGQIRYSSIRAATR